MIIMIKMGFGMMRLPQKDKYDASNVDVEQVRQMVDIYLENGGKYFDTAYPYHDGKCESIIKEVLVDRYPRDKYCLATKLPIFMIEKKEEIERIFDEQLTNCGVEYFDYYLIHAINKYSKQQLHDFNAIDFLRQKKDEGKIRNIGFSFHDTPEFLIEILEVFPDCDFVQLQINYLDWQAHFIESKKCYEIAKKYNKPVIVMEPVKGGILANLPEKAKKIYNKSYPNLEDVSWALRFCNQLDNVSIILNGVSSIDQMKSSLDIFKNIKPLNDEELSLVSNVTEIMNELISIKCTECDYCAEYCPKEIAISGYFLAYNNFHLNKEDGDLREIMDIVHAEEEGEFLDACIECNQCVKHCPQNLDIPQYLKKISKEMI